MTEIIVPEEETGVRLDAFIAVKIPDLSRSAAQRLVGEGCVLVDSQPAKSSQRLKAGQIVSYTIPPAAPTDVLPEEIPLNVVYEDEDLLVINKPKNMVVHPAPGAPEGTLVNALLAHCDGLSGIGGVQRPGIVHRLDKDTSGLMVVAKNDKAHRELQRQIQARTAGRRYLALVWGNPRFEEAVIDAPIGRHPSDRKKMAVISDPERHRAREAVTEVRVIERFGPFSVVEARLQTGRTHQVRVHLAYAGHPVVGDPVYSGNRRMQSGPRGFVDRVNQLIDELGGQALHAYSLSFTHPRTGEPLAFTTPMPPEMASLVEYLREECGK